MNIWVEKGMESHSTLYKYVNENFKCGLKDNGFLFGSFQGVTTAIGFDEYHSFENLNAKFDINFDYHNFLIDAKELAFNNDGEFMPYSYFYENRAYFYAKHGREGKLFIRPNSGFKTVPSGLWDIQKDLHSLHNSVISMKRQDELIYISSPKEIKLETRFFIWDNKIVDSCVYSVNGEFIEVHNTPHQATTLVQDFIKKGLYCDKAYVIDVVMTDGNRFKLLETNGYFTSGLYACEPENIVEPIVEFYKTLE